MNYKDYNNNYNHQYIFVMESNVKKENESNAISNIKIDEYQPNSEEKTKFEQTIDAINKGISIIIINRTWANKKYKFNWYSIRSIQSNKIFNKNILLPFKRIQSSSSKNYILYRN